VVQIGASPRVGGAQLNCFSDGRNAQAAAVRGLTGQPFQPLNPGRSERFGTGHDVRLGDGDEIACAEIFLNLDLMLDRPLHGRAALPARIYSSSSVSSMVSVTS
jgi:hypothetical protein